MLNASGYVPMPNSNTTTPKSNKKGKNVTVTTSLRSLSNLEENTKTKQGYVINSLLQGHESPYKDVMKVAAGEYVIFDFKISKGKNLRILKDSALIGKCMEFPKHSTDRENN